MDTALDKQQRQAVKMITTEPISLLTGGPGTGKTTCLKATIAELALARRSYALCAPTGKAARRITEQTSAPAYTIHRLLGYDGMHYRRGPLSLLSYSAIIVDESSMIDIHLAARLLEAVERRRASVTFIGDADQLPPVGQGCPFRDLIATYEGEGELPVIRLRETYRQDEGSGITINAPKILAGEALDFDTDDFNFYELSTNNGKHIPGIVVDLIKKLDNPDDVQVLTPTKLPRYVGSTIDLNRALQKAINPGKDSGWTLDDEPVRVGSRVMQIRNDYKLERFNGEVGKITRTDRDKLVVKYDNGLTSYNFEAARYLRLAYAATIHKAQGSEFPYVIVILHSGQPLKLLTRQLFYTAVTRAKKKVYIVGDESGLNMARRNIDDTRRRTLLVDRLKGLI